MKGKLSGFTLIELIISIGVIAILSSIGLASYVQFNRRQILNSAVRTFLNDLQLAQSKAESNERPQGCSGNLLSYQVSIQTSGYKVEAICSSSVEIKNIDFPERVGKTSGFDWVKFKTLRGGVEVFPSVQNFLVLTAFGKDRTVTIGSAGEISSQ